MHGYPAIALRAFEPNFRGAAHWWASSSEERPVCAISTFEPKSSFADVSCPFLATAKKGGHQGLLLRYELPIDDHLTVHAAIVIQTTVPSAITIVITADNHRTAFAVNSPKPAIMVAVAEPHVDILGECGDCDAQSYNRRNNE
jgi:hypothetical protein